MNKVNERIKHIVDTVFERNTSAFARYIDVKRTTVNGIIGDGVSKPSYDIIEKIVESDLNISPEWLLTGKGNMRKGESADLMNEINVAASKLENDGFPVASYRKGVPYYNVDFIGGFDLVCNDQTTKPDYYIDFSPYNEEGTIWCNITGHSMEPEINNGDMIALKEVKEWNNFLTYGEIYAIVTKNGMRTVKIVSRGDDNDSFKLVPINENKKYSIQDIQKSMIDKVFKVMGCMKRL